MHRIFLHLHRRFFSVGAPKTGHKLPTTYNNFVTQIADGKAFRDRKLPKHYIFFHVS